MEETEEGFVKMRKDTLVLIVVALAFVGVLVFVVWDLYGGDLGQDLETQVSGERPGEESKSLGEVDSSTYESCISNTKDEPECKDCCDCLVLDGHDSGEPDTDDGKVRTDCRDECAFHDFSGNSDFITVSAPSVLGVSGDYSECSGLSGKQECKSCCEDSMGLRCGDYRHCRTACNEVFE